MTTRQRLEREMDKLQTLVPAYHIEDLDWTWQQEQKAYLMILQAVKQIEAALEVANELDEYGLPVR